VAPKKNNTLVQIDIVGVLEIQLFQGHEGDVDPPLIKLLGNNLDKEKPRVYLQDVCLGTF
jgi:hypothetical protein